MKNKHLLQVGIVLISTQIIGCDNKDRMRWKEQVWLSGGQFIEVDRYSVALKSGFPNSTDGPTIYREISYEPMGVHWSSNDPVNVMRSFDIVGDSAYLVVSTTEEKSDFCVGKEKGELLVDVYRWRNQKLEKVSQNDAPIKKMRVNLSGDGNWRFRHADKPKKYFSWEDVAYSTLQPSSNPPELIYDYYSKRSKRFCE
ncbi:hypothetical protein HF319_04415 [Xanthomonas sp. Kuri4-1]